jgi:ABC-2 type transport system permease protein
MVDKKPISAKAGRKAGRRWDITVFLIVAAVVVFTNYISSVKFYRIDLTAENRFSLSDSTKAILQDLDDVVYVQCYLEGDNFPAGIKRLRNETRELLNEFRAYGGTNFEYEFINPFSDPDKASQQKMIRQLVEDGLQPTNLQNQEEEGSQQLLIFPGALVTYKGRTVAIELLRSQVNRQQEVVLNESIESLEYEFSRAIYILKGGMVRKNISFTVGHGEIAGPAISDFGMDLSRLYNVKGVQVTSDLKSIPMETGLLIIAKPTMPYNEGEKFVLDQFVMRGGRILWLIDNVSSSMDSLARSQSGVTVGLPLQLNLDDLLFRYGVRLNYEIVLDAQSGSIPLVVGMYGNQPQTELKPWYYFPVVTPDSKNIIVDKLPNLRLEFVGTIDTVKAEGVQKTILLHSSDLSKSLMAPIRIALSMVDQPADGQSFNKKKLPLAVLLEGKFTSAFSNRIVARKDLEPGLQFKDKSEQTKMIVLADGDIIRNRFNAREGSPYPLGFDPKSGEYNPANKTFLLNCVNYLMDDGWLIPLRTKQFKVRLLDKKKIQQEAFQWKLVNMTIPIVITILLGLVFMQIRKYRYGRK